MTVRISTGRTWRLAAVALAASLALAACGSDDNNNGGSSGLVGGNSVAPSAGVSSGSFLDAVKQVVAQGMNETGEALSVQGVAQPPEDTSEPVAI